MDRQSSRLECVAMSSLREADHCAHATPFKLPAECGGEDSDRLRMPNDVFCFFCLTRSLYYWRQKIDSFVRSSVRPSVRSSVRFFVRSFRSFRPVVAPGPSSQTKRWGGATAPPRPPPWGAPAPQPPRELLGAPPPNPRNFGQTRQYSFALVFQTRH